MTRSFSSPQSRVYVHHTDVAGVVHHSNYLRFFEEARIEFLRAIGEDYIQFQNNGIGFVPTNMSIQYLKPLRQDDVFHVDIHVQSVRKASFVIQQSILSNHECMASATIQLACVKEPEFKPHRLPQSLIKKL